VLSIAGNAIHAAPRRGLAAVIAAALPLTLFLSFEQLLRILTAIKPDGPADQARAGRDIDSGLNAGMRYPRTWQQRFKSRGLSR
jgi:hypothetical protein